MAVEVSTGIFATSEKTCIYMYLMLCEYFCAILFTFPPFYLSFTPISGEFIVFFVQYFTCFALFRIIAHLVTWLQSMGFPLEIVISSVNLFIYSLLLAL